ncbi:unnamed protein product [Lactuca virosa]|uniref:Methyltransferase domain-containing protein n=1 Tax=Lactuca virosa TaxID=75947 RepID=A0AAU9P7V1_9ASTR|nr:unnamed protein product [Lactuca virosa]
MSADSYSCANSGGEGHHFGDVRESFKIMATTSDSEEEVKLVYLVHLTMTSNGNCKYSCATATETLEWIRASIDFINPYSFFWESHVVNFLTHELWKAVDKEWIDCLRKEPVEYLVQIPSGFVQDHWPSSLKKFITTSSSLAFPREQADLEKVLPNMQVALLNAVITQGMNPKKKHEIEALAGVVSSVARDVETNTVIDVGAGQGYLAQVLSFEYQLSVIAVDSSSHHGTITHTRAQRIKKHYDARKHKSRHAERFAC